MGKTCILKMGTVKAGNIFNKASSEQKEEPYLCSEIHMYDVIEEFPKLIRSDVPDGVVDANYSLSVSSIQSFSVTEDLENIIKNG